MKLIIQPDDGLTPVVRAVKKARKSIDIVIFRFDRAELEKALEAAVARGVVVRALIAHTNRGGDKNLRKLELKLLQAGITVARSADDLPRYHAKMMVVDDTLHVYVYQGCLSSDNYVAICTIETGTLGPTSTPRVIARLRPSDSFVPASPKYKARASR